MKKLLIVAALLAAVATAPASAQDTAWMTKYLAGDPASVNFTNATQAGDVALLIKYNPGSAALTKPSGTVQATTTTLLFKSGLAAAEVADALVTCPSGGTAGTVLLTDAACDTIGEVVDVINASVSDRWKAVNWASFRTDSTNNKFVASAAASANASRGRSIVWDTALTLFAGGVLVPNGDIPDIKPFLSNNFQLVPTPNMFGANRAGLVFAQAALTSTTPNFRVYSVLPAFSDNGSSETVTLLYDVRIVTATVTSVWSFGGYPLLAKKGEKMLIRTIGAGTATAPYLSAYGTVFPK